MDFFGRPYFGTQFSVLGPITFGSTKLVCVVWKDAEIKIWLQKFWGTCTLKISVGQFSTTLDFDRKYIQNESKCGRVENAAINYVLYHIR